MPNILLIEDEIDLRQFYSEFLKSSGYNVIEAADGEEGLKKAQVVSWAALLLDIMLPRLDGIEVLRAIKTAPNLAELPVILLTNLDKDEIVQECLKLGANGYLVKSNINPDALINTLNSVLAPQSNE